jgi:hypothetical protein
VFIPDTTNYQQTFNATHGRYEISIITNGQEIHTEQLDVQKGQANVMDINV